MLGSRRRLTFALAAAVWCAACGGSDPFEARAVQTKRVDASWSTTERNESYEVRKDAEWQAVWQLHEPMTIPHSTLPNGV